MKAIIFSFTRNGAKLNGKLRTWLSGQGYLAESYSPQAYCENMEGFQRVEPDMKAILKETFPSCSLVIFIGACGIGVRAIAPFIQDKQKDPAVLCIDEKGTYVIPLLSGHIGGANRLALSIAENLGAQPVITTATDINGLLSVDQWAREQNLSISNLKAAKKISALFLEGKGVGLDSEFEVTGEIPSNFLLTRECPVGVSISLDEKRSPYETTLHLIPRIVCLGIGCRKGVSLEDMEKFVLEILEENKISLKAIDGIATIDLKREEMGLVAFAAKYQLPLTFFTFQELKKACGSYTGSAFVKQITGIDNVCERAAVLLSGNGSLMVGKKAGNGITAALARKSWRVNFED